MHEAVTATIRGWSDSSARPSFPRQQVGDVALVPLFPNAAAVTETHHSRNSRGCRYAFGGALTPEADASLWEEMLVFVAHSWTQGTAVAEVKSGEPLNLPPGDYRLRVMGEVQDGSAV
jgi:hypothetical protein